MVQTQTRFRVRTEELQKRAKIMHTVPQSSIIQKGGLLGQEGLDSAVKRAGEGLCSPATWHIYEKVDGTLESLDHYITEGAFWSGKWGKSRD